MSSMPTERDSKRMVEKKPSTLSPFRYPGGKTALRSKIISWIGGLGFRPHYFLEPFAGGASIGLAVAELDLANSVILTELDPDVAAVWNVILNGQAHALATKIRTFNLTESSARDTLSTEPCNRFR